MDAIWIWGGRVDPRSPVSGTPKMDWVYGRPGHGRASPTWPGTACSIESEPFRKNCSTSALLNCDTLPDQVDIGYRGRPLAELSMCCGESAVWSGSFGKPQGGIPLSCLRLPRWQSQVRRRTGPLGLHVGVGPCCWEPSGTRPPTPAVGLAAVAEHHGICTNAGFDHIMHDDANDRSSR